MGNGHLKRLERLEEAAPHSPEIADYYRPPLDRETWINFVLNRALEDAVNAAEAGEPLFLPDGSNAPAFEKILHNIRFGNYNPTIEECWKLIEQQGKPVLQDPMKNRQREQKANGEENSGAED